MSRASVVSRRAEELLGTPVVATSPVAGGDVARATKLRLNDGSVALMKTLPHPPQGFFPAEARGLAWLAEVGLPVPDLLAAAEDCVILRWIEPGKPSGEGAEALGRALASAHRHPCDGYGLDTDGFIGTLPLPNRPAPTWPEFYATRRLLPYLKLAHDRGAIDDDHARTIEAVVPRLADLVPDEPPARLHGDLWNGNVIWGTDGRAWVIDPAAYCGHREMDLAMLALFGLPQLERVIDAYEETHPLGDGWEERIALHQLFPLLVHAALFGQGYGARAATLAARFVSSG
ncbi:fructosamine kinase family protein [Nocardioides sp. CER19]|uniref:fructosamine kinase family protein n=1 Tax=Nocardioides sp. CER19 TaxID=3038538 RepID=UPI00244C96D1|nr:fructosamine kinase family protein [Nocardioides sp. CER19]MDH2413149.1 fructosamine kinase family protein [Nocardioides sp. CER19]